jgi:hypothetical protein
MAGYISTQDFTTPSLPGWVFKLRKMSHGRRMKLRELAASVNAELREARQGLSVINDQIMSAESAAKLLPCTCEHPPEGHDSETRRCTVTGCQCRKPDVDDNLYAERNKVAIDQIWNNLITGKLYPILIEWAFQSVRADEGYETNHVSIDDQPVTAQLLLERMPDGVIIELGECIDKMTQIDPDEQLVFKLPGT